MTAILNLAQISATVTIAANADWRQTFALVDANDAPVDLAGIDFVMQIRPSVGSGDILATLSIANAKLARSETLGALSAVLTAEETKMLVNNAGGAVADILAMADGAVVNLCLTPLQVQIVGGVTWP